MADGEFAASLAVVSLGTSIYTSFLPPFPRVLTAIPTPEAIEQVRVAEMVAGGVVLAIGMGLGVFTGSKMPLAVAVLIVVGMTLIYETFLRKDGYDARSL